MNWNAVGQWVGAFLYGAALYVAAPAMATVPPGGVPGTPPFVESPAAPELPAIPPKYAWIIGMLGAALRNVTKSDSTVPKALGG